MKKINTVLCIGLLIFIGCQTENELTEKQVGYLDFQLGLDTNPEMIVTRAIDTDVDDFVVEITGGNNYTKTFSSYKDLKQEGILELEEGSYSICAYNNTTENIPVHAYLPTCYRGETTFLITAGVPTIVAVDCQRQEVEIGLDLSPLVEIGINNINAFIYLENNELFKFEVNQITGKTDTHFFAPHPDLQIYLKGTYNGFELGDLGGPHKIIEISEDITEIKGHTLLIIKVSGVEPVSSSLSGLTLKRVSDAN